MSIKTLFLDLKKKSRPFRFGRHVPLAGGGTLPRLSSHFGSMMSRQMEAASPASNKRGGDRWSVRIDGTPKPVPSFIDETYDLA
jgi:hypothetical protein